MWGLRGFSKGALARHRFISTLASDESGQGTLEYILILSVTVVAASAFARAMLGTLDRGILKLGGTLEKDLKTGRAQVNVWEN